MLHFFDIAALLGSACLASAYLQPAPAYIVKPKPFEYQNWLPDHPGHGHFSGKNNTKSPWYPVPCHHPPHYPHPGQCGVNSPEPQDEYWLPNFKGVYEGTSPFLVNGSNYKVFRNVKDFGAVGDGKHDDTRAFNRAISCKT